MSCNCTNCQHVDKQKATALKATNEAANKGVAVSDHVVAMWNETLRLFPCLNKTIKED